MNALLTMLDSLFKWTFSATQEVARRAFRAQANIYLADVMRRQLELSQQAERDGFPEIAQFLESGVKEMAAEGQVSSEPLAMAPSDEAKFLPSPAGEPQRRRGRPQKSSSSETTD